MANRRSHPHGKTSSEVVPFTWQPTGQRYSARFPARVLALWTTRNNMFGDIKLETGLTVWQLKPSPALDAVRFENKTAGNERERIGTRRSEPAGQAVFPQVEVGVRIPLAGHLAAPHNSSALRIRRCGPFPPESSCWT